MGAQCCGARLPTVGKIRAAEYRVRLNTFLQPWVNAIVRAIQYPGAEYKDSFVRVAPAPRHVNDLTEHTLEQNLLGVPSDALPVAVYVKDTVRLLPCNAQAFSMLQDWARRTDLATATTACQDGTQVLLLVARPYVIDKVYRHSKLPNLPPTVDTK